MKVNIGSLNKRISIVRRTVERDADGYETVQDNVVHTCWAQFTRKSGAETIRENADFGQTKARFLIRSVRTKIDRKMIVKYAGDEYEIEFVNEYGDSHQFTELMCVRTTRES